MRMFIHAGVLGCVIHTNTHLMQEGIVQECLIGGRYEDKVL
jgi:hypothetical protein